MGRWDKRGERGSATPATVLERTYAPPPPQEAEPTKRDVALDSFYPSPEETMPVLVGIQETFAPDFRGDRMHSGNVVDTQNKDRLLLPRRSVRHEADARAFP